MAVIDSDAGEIVIRLVYDGPPEAGKTTSLRALAGSLTRPSQSPAEDENGRTLWFDWMEYVGGRFEGCQIRCQVVSVAGQRELATRRRRVLAGADVVVFVADSAARELPTTVAYLGELRAMLADVVPAVGVILQANKRDLPEAVPLATLRAALAELGWPIGVVESTAAAGTGIREAFVYAVRLALDRVREQLAGGPVSLIPAGIAGTADDLLAAIRADEAAAMAAAAPVVVAATAPLPPPGLPAVDLADVDATWSEPAPDAPAAELDDLDDFDADAIDFAALDFAAIDALDALDAIDAADTAASDAAELGADVSAASAAPVLASDAQSLAAELFRDVVASEHRPLSILPPLVAPGPSIEPPAEESPAAEPAEPPGSAPTFALPLPTLPPRPPTTSVPSGAIWPPVDGRAILQELSTLELSPRRLSTGDWIAGLGTGWRVMSNRDAIFHSLDDGRAALIQWARLHSTAADALSAPRCIVLADEGTGAWRLWQVVQAQPSLRDAVEDALHDSDSRDAMLAELRRIAHALIDADVQLAALPVRLPCTLDNIGASDNGAVYIGLMPPFATPLVEPRPRRDSHTILHASLEPVIGRDLQDHSLAVDDLLDRPAPHAGPSIPIAPGITAPLPAIPAPKPHASPASETGTSDGIARTIANLLGA